MALVGVGGTVAGYDQSAWFGVGSTAVYIVSLLRTTRNVLSQDSADQFLASIYLPFQTRICFLADRAVVHSVNNISVFELPLVRSSSWSALYILC